MIVREGESRIEVWAPAKLNLSLEVLARRDDGFHEIETLMVPISLWDTVEFWASPTPEPLDRGLPTQDNRTLRFVVRRGKDSRGAQATPEEIPEGADNLVVRAVELLRRRAGIETGGTIRLTKRIPLAAGLGGGSSDAAAALAAANLGWRVGYSPARLAALAAELGSDIPFFFACSPAICRGRGERVEPIDRLGPLHFVVVHPPEGLSTADVYRHCQAASRPREVAPLVDALRVANLGRAGRLLVNRLQAPAARLSSSILQLKEEFTKHGFLGHQLSGSGTSYFGLSPTARHARRAAARLNARGLGRTYAVRTCP